MNSCFEFYNRKIDVKSYFDSAVKALGYEAHEVPPMVKGIRRMSSDGREVENLAKGVLRAKYNLSVNKDGTIRYDATEVPLTHFKPKEIRVGVEKLRSLGYDKDIRGDELKNENQVLELKPHDVVLPSCSVGPVNNSSLWNRSLPLILSSLNNSDPLILVIQLPPTWFLHRVLSLQGHSSCHLSL